ncbi:hypothetical protein D3C80_1079330 [compost metagenome]
MALLSRLRRIRANSWISLCTLRPHGTYAIRKPSLAAAWAYSAARLSSRSLTAKLARSALITPASSLEMSTRVPSRFSTSSSELLTLRTSAGLALLCSSKALVNSRAAFKGCNRSWLTAARNLVFDRLACSASCLAWLSSAVRSRTRTSRFW